MKRKGMVCDFVLDGLVFSSVGDVGELGDDEVELVDVMFLLLGDDMDDFEDDVVGDVALVATGALSSGGSSDLLCRTPGMDLFFGEAVADPAVLLLRGVKDLGI